MPRLNSSIISPELSRLLTMAGLQMRRQSLPQLSPFVLLATLLEQPSSAQTIVRKLFRKSGMQVDDLMADANTVGKYIEGTYQNVVYRDEFETEIPLSAELVALIEKAIALARDRNEKTITSAYILGAMTHPPSPIRRLLESYGLAEEWLTNALTETGSFSRSITTDLVAAARMSKAPAFYDRTALQRKIVTVATRSQPPHMILVGAQGVGKHALIRSFGPMLARENNSIIPKLIQIDEDSLEDDAERALEAGLKQADRGILMIPNIGRFFKLDGRQSQFPSEATRIISRALLHNVLIIIGTATEEEYASVVNNSLIRENTTRITVPATDILETEQIVKSHRERLEEVYGLELDEGTPHAIAVLADRYLSQQANPGASIFLAEKACHRATSLSDIDGRYDNLRYVLYPEDVIDVLAKLTNEQPDDILSWWRGFQA